MKWQVRIIGAALGFALLSGCHQPTGGNEAESAAPLADVTPEADPTKDDAWNAIKRIAPLLRVSYSIYDVGAPTQCQGGQLNGTSVKSCTVCATMFTIHTGQLGQLVALRASRSLFSVVFKKAISVLQPEISPTSGGGVWVASLPAAQAGQPSPPPPILSDTSADLVADDVRLVGLQRDEMGYTQGFQLRPAGQNLAFPLSEQAILNSFSSREAKQLVHSKVADCDGKFAPRPEAPAPPRTEEIDMNAIMTRS